MIIFLFGADTFRSRQKLKEIKDKFLREVDSSGMNMQTLDGKTADFFSEQIKERLRKREKMYNILDIGSFQGELLSSILSKLPEYHFEPIALDINEEALSKNIASEKRVAADAERMPFEDGSVNLAIVQTI